MDKRRKSFNPLIIPVRLTVALAVLVVVSVAAILLVSNSSPEEAGPIGVTLMFILLYVATLTTLTLVKMIILRTTAVSLDRLVGLALIPTIIIAMRSLRQLTVVDVVLIVVFAILVNVYLKKATNRDNSN